MAGRTMLQFDWETVDGRVVSSILGQDAGIANKGIRRCWAVAFLLDELAVVLRVNADTDEVLVSLETLTDDDEAPWTSVSELGEFVGRKLGWCWVCRNYRGYLDSFMLAFDGIDPDLMFIAEASTLQFKLLGPVLSGADGRLHKS